MNALQGTRVLFAILHLWICCLTVLLTNAQTLRSRLPLRDQSAERTVAARPITVMDAIGMRELSYEKDIVHYSPDGTKLVVVVKQGNLERDTNDYSLLFWKTDELFRRPNPEVLLTMSSSSNRRAIENLNWLPDNDTLVFLGENPGERRQVYSFKIKTHSLAVLTRHSTNVTWFSVSGDGSRIAYSAEGPQQSCFDSKTDRSGLVITTQWLPPLLRDLCRGTNDQQLFVAEQGQPAQLLRTIDKFTAYFPYGPPTISPDGRFVVLTTHPRQAPAAWTGYADAGIHAIAAERLQPGQESWLCRYELIDVETKESRILIDAPSGVYGTEFSWLPDSRSLIIANAYLPLPEVSDHERAERESSPFIVEVKIPSGKLVPIVKNSDEDLILEGLSPDDNSVVLRKGRKKYSHLDELADICFRKRGEAWEAIRKERKNHLPEIDLRQDMNTPPQVLAKAPATKNGSVLLDLNPQFRDLQFGRVEEVNWNGVDGSLEKAGLYYPIGFEPGKRYPLVIQTHGWNAGAFLIDGIFHSAFAAQALAGRGIMVLQADEAHADQGTTKELQRETARFEEAIDYLDQKGLIDRSRVGIVGFSRTCYFVKYILTHSKFRFAAASMEDGMEASYFQYLVWGNSNQEIVRQFEGFNDGPPFGTNLQSWVARSPGFSLDKVHTPVRFVQPTPNTLLEDWEWFIGLSRLGRPVELVMMRDGAHPVVKPWDRMISQQGNVDWFCFWLQREEDPSPEKKDQYSRWRELRKRQDAGGETSERKDHAGTIGASPGSEFTGKAPGL
jgi:dipeptidyl aminopeptidase/acylaminoacyl peptidase